jgi:hypothetical protein
MSWPAQGTVDIMHQNERPESPDELNRAGEPSMRGFTVTDLAGELILLLSQRGVGPLELGDALFQAFLLSSARSMVLRGMDSGQ